MQVALILLSALAQESAPEDAPRVAIGAGPAQLSIGAEFRIRAETRDPLQPLAGGDRDSLQSGRFRLGVEAAAGEDLSAFMEFQKTILAEGEDSLDSVHQALLRWSAAGGLADLEVGRFELDQGSGLLLGSDDWSATGRAFDGVRVARRAAAHQVHLFWTQPVEGQAAPDGVDQTVAGLWASFDRAPLGIEFYGLTRNDRSGSLSDVADATYGGRIRGEHASFGWSAEAALQSGDHGAEDAGGLLAAARLRQGIGRARLALGALYASGDGTAGDGDDDAFLPLYEDSHRILGLQDIVALSNVLDLHVEAGCSLGAAWDLSAVVHSFSAAEKDGPLPAPGLTGVAGEDEIGQELDLVLSGEPLPGCRLELGLGKFFAGSMIAGGEDQTWVYAQVVVGL